VRNSNQLHRLASALGPACVRVSGTWANTTYFPKQTGLPCWLTETAAACGGGNRQAATFLDTFRYLNQLGRLARQDVMGMLLVMLAVQMFMNGVAKFLKP
jgi:small neutral amino acid transporter SnatA (MarC family)